MQRFFNFFTNRKRKKLTTEELDRLSLAYELHSFTTTYKKMTRLTERKKHVVKHLPVSQSVNFLATMMLEAMENAQHMCPTHLLRISRNFVRTINTAIVKLRQDGFKLRKCAECKADKSQNSSDRFLLVGLGQYIMHGFDKGAKDAVKAFEKYFEKSRQLIATKVKTI